MSEKDVFDVFDEMFKKLDNDEYKDTSLDDFKKDLSETMNTVAKQKGYDDFEKMNTTDKKILELFEVKEFTDREDYIIQALSIIDDETIQTVVKRLKNGESVENLEPEVKKAVALDKNNVSLKIINEVFSESKNKMIEKIHLEMADM